MPFSVLRLLYAYSTEYSGIGTTPGSWVEQNAMAREIEGQAYLGKGRLSCVKLLHTSPKQLLFDSKFNQQVNWLNSAQFRAYYWRTIQASGSLLEELLLPEAPPIVGVRFCILLLQVGTSIRTPGHARILFTTARTAPCFGYILPMGWILSLCLQVDFGFRSVHYPVHNGWFSQWSLRHHGLFSQW